MLDKVQVALKAKGYKFSLKHTASKKRGGGHCCWK